MLHQRQAVGDDAGRRVALDIAGIFLRPRKLQQLGHDLADAVDLLVEQAELDLRLVGLGAEHAADDVEIALHHRDRIVDLVRHAGGDLADRGQLLGHDELLGGRLRASDWRARDPRVRSRRARSTPRSIRASCRSRSWIWSSRLSRWNRHAADLVARHRHAWCGRTRLPPSTSPIVAVTRSSGMKIELRPAQEDRHGRRRDRDERQRDDQQRLVLGVAERLLQKADIEHADALAVAVDQRLVGGDVPVVDRRRRCRARCAPRPAHAERTAADTRVPSARRPSNRRTLVEIRTSSRNSVAVPWLPSGRLAAR